MKPELADWLDYLADLGYDEIYRDQASGVVRGGATLPSAGARQAGSGRGTAPPAERARSESAGDATDAPPPEARRTELEAVAREASACTRCALAEGRRTVVFGSGNPDADLMFIGEGPGAEEDRQGLPFVGPAGQLLTRIIQAIDLSRDDVYIANIVKCRPPGNREPLPDEVAACRPWLEAQIRLVRPRVIVALGKVAAQALLGDDGPIGKLRGRWHTVAGIPLMPTYHPAALLRNAGLKRPVWDDMLRVRERLRTASERQR
ncbi:MAG: uracil-DNA glycosylase [Thermoanaerobaculia bacterium]